ncbi:hypothetical protein HYDPIDRAFT_168894 [Hydnomerulius pinastri MD-312]|uniref:Uncharacterized protein n=1 Tax=Hydnomerulius pinastri MD-312 TaxID=994086 RepID=A0A0C9VBB0_9AGAM|nr:hypothetical protein HYDPIDRAFT_168894 [Hydnomerulius pinastri MD-312]
MDVHPHLNYQYPATIDPALLHLPQQSVAHPQYQQIMHSQLVQNPVHPMATPYHHQIQGSSRVPQTWGGLDHPSGGCSTSSQQAAQSDRRGTDNFGPAYGHTKSHSVGGQSKLSDKYIPSSSDKITCADHRPLDEIFGNPFSSSGWPRAPQPLSQPHHIPSQSSHGQQQQGSHLYEHANHQPRTQAPPVLTYTLPTKPQLDGVLQIPLLAVDNRKSGTGLVIDFRCSDWGIGVQMEGIPMMDLLHHHARGLERGHERVLDGLGLTIMRLNILWPNYPPFTKSISAFGEDGKPITRAGLGHKVAQAFAQFFCQISPWYSAQPGLYTIAPPQGSLPGRLSGIRFNQLHLISVRNTSCGEWMAEVRAAVGA